MAYKGCIPWNKGLTKETDSRVKEGWCKGYTKETHSSVAKQANQMIGNQNGLGHKFNPSEITRSRMSDASLARWSDPFYREYMIEVHTGCIQSEESNIKRSIALVGLKREDTTRYKLAWTDERKKAKSDYWKECYNDPKWRSRMFNYREGMNKEETSLMNVIESLGIPFRYVGNYAYKIGSCFPDFIMEDKRLIIELFGDYWHNGENPQDRIDYFRQFGWDTLVIWASEMKVNRENVIERIKSFSEV